MTLPYSKVFQLRRRDPRDLPDVPEFFSADMLAVKDDLYRMVSKKLNPRTLEIDVIIKLTAYYNIFALAFGYDTMEFYFHIDGRKHHLKYVNLYEKMSPEEQRVVDYVAGVLRHIDESDKLIRHNQDPTYNVRASNREAYGKLFSSENGLDERDDQSLQAINIKFPEVYVADGVAYMYKNSYFESVNNAPAPTMPILNIPFTSQFKEITEIFNIGTEIDFKDKCHKLLDKKIDPLQTFIKSNFIKSFQARNSIVELTEEEKNLLGDFMSFTSNPPSSLVADNGSLRPISSDVKLVNSFSNLKKISTKFKFSSFDEEMLQDLRIGLVKRKIAGEEIQTLRPSDEFQNQKKYCAISRAKNLGSFPVNFPRKKNGLQVDIAIERNQFRDGEIKVYSENRSVSRDEGINGGFLCKDLKSESQKLITNVPLSVIGDNLLKRDILINFRTGEMLVNSTVSPSKKMGIYNNTRMNQLLSNIKLFVTSIPRGTGENRGLPKNVIRILGKHSSLMIKKVVCKPIGSGSPFKLPIEAPTVNEVYHIDPIANGKYTYEIYFSDDGGTGSEHPLSITHRTLPRGPSDIELAAPYRDSNVMRVNIADHSPPNMAENIRSSLAKVFEGVPNAANFYEEFFSERINTNLQNIGKLFQLYVTYYNKKLGTERSIPLASKKDENGTCYFNIKVGGAPSDHIITYHLIITNPLELVTAGFEDIEDPKTRELFKRRTAAYFNTFTLTRGELPAEYKEPKTDAKFYINNSRLPPLDPYNRITCIGGIIEENQSPEKIFHTTRELNSLYYPDDGECIVSWKSFRVESSREHIDFFVVTAEIANVEFPVTAHPFIGFTTYKVRTMSFLGAASKVKFRVYTVYNDFHVQSHPENTEVIVTDIRKMIQER